MVQVVIDRPLVSRDDDFKLSSPWGFTFESGVHCVIFTGAVGAFHRKLERYDCPRRDDKLNALVPLQRDSQPWTADTVRFNSNYAHARSGPTAAIAVAYYPTSHLRTTPRSLPFTGPAADIGAAELYGLTSVLLGAILLVAARRRRET